MCNNAYDTYSLQFCDMNHEPFFLKGALCSFGEEIQTQNFSLFIILMR